MTISTLDPSLNVATPEWWRDRLFARLRARRAALVSNDKWYSGEHPAPRMYSRAAPALRYLLEMAQANFLGLVVDAALERMFIEGFRVNGEIDGPLWDIWQGNNFDAGIEQVFTERLAVGEALVLVDPKENEFGFPTITPEHPLEAIVEYEPGSAHRRAAGLKSWYDDTTGLRYATLWLPDSVTTWAGLARSAALSRAAVPTWQEDEAGTGDNELGEVPLVPFRNRPRMLREGTAEFAQVIPIQQRVNKTILDRLVNQDFGAFKQKWVTGMDIPVDPETNEPVEPFQSAIDRAFYAEDPETKFGQFEPEDIKQLLDGVDADIRQMAAIVPTPPHYLLGALVNIGAEALKAAEASLVSRIRRHQRAIDEPAEAVARLSLKAAGESVPNVSRMETLWRNPEFRTEGELVDALVKMSSLGVPKPALWQRWGATPQEITDWTAQQTEADAIAGLGAILAGQTETAPADVEIGAPAP